jgi:hypothetical protein
LLRREARNRKREYLKDKTNVLATYSKNNIRELYRGIKEFKKGYQPRTNLVKDENDDLLADSHNILNKWKNYFFQLLNVYRVSDVRQTELHTAEPLAPEPSTLEAATAIAKLKAYKLPGNEQILADIIQARGETLHSEINKLINFICNMEERLEQWKESITVPI